MSAALTPEQRNELAAEFASACWRRELARARALAAADPQFTELVAHWSDTWALA